MHMTETDQLINIKTWDKEAAGMAQSYAEQCNGLTHNSQQGRWTRRFGSCGENIFISTHKVSWQFAMKSWFSEKDLFTYGCSRNNLTEVTTYLLILSCFGSTIFMI